MSVKRKQNKVSGRTCPKYSIVPKVMLKTQVSCRTLPEAALTLTADAAGAAEGFAAAVNAAKGTASGVVDASPSSEVPEVLLVDEVAAAALNLPPDDAVNAGARFIWEQVRAVGCAVEQDVIAREASWGQPHGRDVASC